MGAVDDPRRRAHLRRGSRRQLSRPLSPRTERSVVALLALVSAILTALATRHGPGLSPDSTYYLSTAENLGRHGELIDLFGQRVTVFAPGLPALYSAGVLLGIDAEVFARVVCIAGAATVTILAWFLVRTLRLPPPLEVGTAVLIATSPVLLAVARMAWTETPFIAVSLGVLLLLQRALQRGADRLVELGALVALCWSAFALRYSGLALIAVAIVVVAVSPAASLARRVATCSGFALLALSFPVAWMLRNHAIDGFWFGPRDPSRDSVRVVAARVDDVVAQWAAPFAPTALESAVVVVALLGAAVTSFATVVLARTEEGRARLRSLVPLALLVFGYGAHLVAAQLNSAFDPLDSRLLSPTYVPAVCLVVSLATAVSRRAWVHGAVALTGALAVFAMASAWVTVRDTRQAFTSGIGFNESTWRSSPLAAALTQLPGTGFAITNSEIASYHLWSVARVDLVRHVPTISDIDAYAATAACAGGRVVIAWFWGSPTVVDEYLSDGFVLTVVDAYPDGVLLSARLGSSSAHCDPAASLPLL